MHTPLTLGQLCLLALYFQYALPAFNIGLSIRPPPATIPIIARFVDLMVFLAPDGNFTFVLLASGLCEIIVAEFPIKKKKNLKIEYIFFCKKKIKLFIQIEQFNQKNIFHSPMLRMGFIIKEII
jgi:hypothetical protein